MVMSYIWISMLLAAVLAAALNGQSAALSGAVLTGAQSGAALALSMAGAVCLWSGLSEVMDRSGLSRRLGKALLPILGRLFPSARKDAAVRAALSGNVCANLLGLGNAATPLGIRAVTGMSRYTKPGDASDEMCRLIVMNTASIQLIPANVAALRAARGSAAPFAILPAVWATSLCSVAAGLLAAWCFGRLSRA